MTPETTKAVVTSNRSTTSSGGTSQPARTESNNRPSPQAKPRDVRDIITIAPPRRIVLAIKHFRWEKISQVPGREIQRQVNSRMADAGSVLDQREFANRRRMKMRNTKPQSERPTH